MADCTYGIRLEVNLVTNEVQVIDIQLRKSTPIF